MCEPLVSVVCAWYGRPESIDRTLRSLLNQSYENIEIVVVNDGSDQEDVAKTLDAYGELGVHVIHQENQGFTKAIERAVSESHGAFLSVMGAGDVAHRNKISVQVAYLKENLNAVAVGTGCYATSASKQKRIKYIQPTEKSGKLELERTVPFTHGTVMYRRSAFEKVGGYDPFFEYCQDWELYGRLLAIGEIHGIDEGFYDKYIYPDGATFDPEKSIKQGFYKELARARCKETINQYKKSSKKLSEALDPTRARYLRRSVKTGLALLKMGEWGMAAKWSKPVAKQVISLLCARV